jgi:hypothetical protein
MYHCMEVLWSMVCIWQSTGRCSAQCSACSSIYFVVCAWQGPRGNRINTNIIFEPVLVVVSMLVIRGSHVPELAAQGASLVPCEPDLNLPHQVRRSGAYPVDLGPSLTVPAS